MAVPDNNPNADTRNFLVAKKFHLLRRLSITSLAAMLITASILVFLHQRDQISEHEQIAEHENGEIANHLLLSLDEQIFDLIANSKGLDTQALRTNPDIALFAAELKKVLGPNTLKVKVYNLSGVAVYSSAESEIGGISKHPDWIKNALRDQVESHMEFRDTFLGATGEMHDVYVSLIYIPLFHAGKRIGVFEVYTDATPLFKRIHDNSNRIILTVFVAFTTLYAVLFFSALRADRAVSEWQKHLAEFDEKIHDMAFYDALTQLPNRHLLEDRLEQTMSASKRSGHYAALMFLDMDNFKPLNDAHGHAAGDLLLAEAARRINSCVREVDTVSRIGGDEFVVVLNELDRDKAESAAQASLVAEKIRTTLSKPYAIKVRQTGGAETTIEHRCTSSIGVALFIDHEFSPEDILKRADMAMYQAKEAGRNLVWFYDSKA